MLFRAGKTQKIQTVAKIAPMTAVTSQICNEGISELSTGLANHAATPVFLKEMADRRRCGEKRERYLRKGIIKMLLGDNE